MGLNALGGLVGGGSSLDPTNDDNAVLQHMGKASSQKPEAIDYKGLIKEQALANRTNLANPYGSSTWNKKKNKLTNTFSPGVQPIFDRQIQMAGTPVSGENFNDEIERATFDRAMNLLQPGFEQQTRDFQQSMADRGHVSGGRAYDTEYANLNRAQNTSRENAAMAAVLAGNDAAMRGRGMNLSERGQQFGEMASILGQAPGGQQSNLDVVGPANMALNQAMAQQQQQANNKSSATNAGASLGGAYLLGASDPRLKENAVVVGEFMPGINIYEANYIGNPTKMLCFMSDEVKKIFPEAVITRDDGYDMVNYGYLLNG